MATDSPATRVGTVGHLVWRLSMKWRAAVDRTVAPFGLTHAQYSVLASLRGLARTGVPTQRELAEHTALDPVYVSKLVSASERKGLVTRTVDEVDARAVRVALTVEGRRTIDRAARAVAVLLDELTEPLGGTAGARVARFERDLLTLLAVDDRPRRRKDPA